MARSLRGPAGVFLLGAALLVGAGLVGGTAAQVRAATVTATTTATMAMPATEAWDPYGHGGMVVPLPGGGRVRLVLPSGAASPPAPAVTAPGTDPATAAQPSASADDPDASDVPLPAVSSPVAGAPSATGSASAADPAPVGAPTPPARDGGPSAGPTDSGLDGGPTASPAAPAPVAASAGPSAAVTALPIPVLDPFYPGSSASPGSSTGTAGSGDEAAGSGAIVPPDGWFWQPVGAGPPPLGPQALAGTVPGPVAFPPAGTASSVQAARWEQRDRLLPLGVGLALIGAGAALFGWRLRRP